MTTVPHPMIAWNNELMTWGCPSETVPLGWATLLAAALLKLTEEV